MALIFVSTLAFLLPFLIRYLDHLWLYSFAFAIAIAAASMVVHASMAVKPRLMIAAPTLAALLGLFVANSGFQVRNSIFWSAFRADSALGWKPAPFLTNFELKIAGGAYTVSTDEFGFRNPPDTSRSAYDLLVQGDSNAWGYGVSDREHPCAAIERMSNLSCFNAGVPGYDVNQYVIQGPKLPVRFKRLVLYLNAENDFSLAAIVAPYLYPRPYFTANEYGLRMVDPTPKFMAQIYGYRFIEPYSAFDPDLSAYETGRAWGNALETLVSHFPAIESTLTRCIPAIEPIMVRVGGILNLLTASLGRKGPDLDNFPSQPDWLLLKPDRWPEPFQSYRQPFRQLLSRYLSSYQNPIVVLWPTPKQLFDDQFEHARERLLHSGHDPESIDRWSVTDFLRDVAESAGATVIDMRFDFVTIARSQELFISRDTHLNAMGHATIANAIVRTLSFGAPDPH